MTTASESATPPAPLPTIDSWQPLFPGTSGIEHATGICGTLPPKTQSNVNALRIDLTNERIVLRPSAWEDLRSCGLTVCDFLDKTFDSHTMAAMVAVNANYFDNDASHENRNVAYGLAVSSGSLLTYVYSSTVGAQTPCAILVSESNAAVIGNTESVYDTFALQAKGQRPWTATSGNYYLVHEGKVAGGFPSPDPIAARTVIGLSQAPNGGTPQYLYLLTIDGVENDSGYGATYADAANWLIAAGAYEGFNLDGGGSTTMAKIGNPLQPVQNPQAKLMNVPHDNEQSLQAAERPVAISFGVVILP